LKVDMSEKSKDVTLLIRAASGGDKLAWKKLFKVVYNELHSIAHCAMRKERPDHTLQTTALIHETYLRLVKDQDEGWENRAHFFSTAAKAMRRILVDEARKKKAKKRGKGKKPLPLYELKDGEKKIMSAGSLEEIEELDIALNKLSARTGGERKCTVVELRFFGGLTLEQTAEVLKVSLATVMRDWEFTKAWLRNEMGGHSGIASSHSNG